MNGQHTPNQIRMWKNEDGRIAVSFPYNPIYTTKIKTINEYRWHPEEKYWSLPYSEDVLEKILFAFNGERIDVDPALYLEDLRRELKSRKYSSKTIKAYLHSNGDFMNFVKKNPMEVSNEDVRSYLSYLAEDRNFSASSLNIAINALKFYYGEMLKLDFVFEIKRPVKDRKLPVVLSREEISWILTNVRNIKHKAILMVTYSAGLRVGEVVKLRVEDIDVERRLIHVKGAKGRKDRYTILSEVAMKMLKLYVESYQPEKWLFPSKDANLHITVRTVQRVFEQARNKAGIKKDVTVHSLRHSFTTHLLESGTDLRYIQELIGHMSSKTTEIYTHVSNRELGKIKSPIDSILSLEIIDEIK